MDAKKTITANVNILMKAYIHTNSSLGLSAMLMCILKIYVIPNGKQNYSLLQLQNQKYSSQEGESPAPTALPSGFSPSPRTLLNIFQPLSVTSK